MRFFYNVLVLLGLPFVALYWLWRAISDPDYRQRWYQRFGFGYPRPPSSGPRVWVHAVSVGEVQASSSLVRALQLRLPDANILITTVTPTGADRVRLLFGDSVKHAYVPYDVGPAVSRFYRQVAPDLAIIVETELWPNLYHQAGVRNIPLVLASARISPRSMPRYRRLVGLFRNALSNGIIIAAQSEVDRQRFVELGAPPERTFVSGNIKFDFEHDPEVAAAGERFARNRRTEERRCPDDVPVLLGDTMGEVNMFYAAADIAFVGGSLVPVGGHNLLEPAALSLPIISGPYLFNAEDIAAMFTEQGAVKVVKDDNELHDALLSLFRREQLRDTMGGLAAQLIAANRGAVDRLLQRLEPLIDEPLARIGD